MKTNVSSIPVTDKNGSNLINSRLSKSKGKSVLHNNISFSINLSNFSIGFSHKHHPVYSFYYLYNNNISLFSREVSKNVEYISIKS
jgi:hypothetical protein